MGRPKKQQGDPVPDDSSNPSQNKEKNIDQLVQGVEQSSVQDNKKQKGTTSRGPGRRSKNVEQSKDIQQSQQKKNGSTSQTDAVEQESNKKGRRSKKVIETSDISEFQQTSGPSSPTTGRKTKNTSTIQQTVEENPEEQNDGFQNLELEDYKQQLSKNQLNNLKNQQTPEIVKFDISKEENRILPYSQDQILSKFEYVKIFTHRVQQLEQDMEPLVNNKDSNGNFKSIENIVREEIEQKKLPIVFRRMFKNKQKFYNLQDMIILNNHFNEK